MTDNHLVIDGTGMDFIDRCVSRSNDVLKKNSYHIQLIFMRYDSENGHEAIEKVCRSIYKMSGSLMVTYLVGFRNLDRPSERPYFIQDGRYITFDSGDYDSVHDLFYNLPEQKGKSPQIVIFRVKDGKPVIDDACECQLTKLTFDESSIPAIDSELTVGYDEGYCYNRIFPYGIDSVRPLIKGYSADVKTSKKAFGIIPGMGHLYLHQYTRGFAIFLINALLLISTLIYSWKVICEDFKPASLMIIMITITLVAWYYSIYDLDKVYYEISIGKRKVDYEFLPSKEEPSKEVLPVSFCTGGVMLIFGPLRLAMRIGFEPMEYVLLISLGVILTIIGIILLFKIK